MADINIVIGNKLREARREEGMSQTELGKVLGLSHVAVGLYENAQSKMTVELLFKLSEILNKPISYFIPYENKDAYKTEAEKLSESLLDKHYNLNENLEFSLEMSIRNYLKSKGVSAELSEKVEKILSEINRIV